MNRTLTLLFLLPGCLLAELPDRETLFETARHLYRWNLDETHLEKMIQNDEVVFFVRDIPLELDEGDQSEAAEVIIGGTGFGADLKKSDYSIPEMGLEVKDGDFKIFSVFPIRDDTSRCRFLRGIPLPLQRGRGVPFPDPERSRFSG